MAPRAASRRGDTSQSRHARWQPTEMRPAADPGAAASRAGTELRIARGVRNSQRPAVDAFLRGYRDTDLAARRDSDRDRGPVGGDAKPRGYLKLGTRRAQSIANGMVLRRVKMDGGVRLQCDLAAGKRGSDAGCCLRTTARRLASLQIDRCHSPSLRRWVADDVNPRSMIYRSHATIVVRCALSCGGSAASESGPLIVSIASRRFLTLFA